MALAMASLALGENGFSPLERVAVDDRLMRVSADDPFVLRIASPPRALVDPAALDPVILAVGPTATRVVPRIGRVLQNHLHRVVSPSLDATARRDEPLSVQTTGDVV